MTPVTTGVFHLQPTDGGRFSWGERIHRREGRKPLPATDSGSFMPYHDRKDRNLGPKGSNGLFRRCIRPWCEKARDLSLVGEAPGDPEPSLQTIRGVLIPLGRGETDPLLAVRRWTGRRSSHGGLGYVRHEPQLDGSIPDDCELAPAARIGDFCSSRLRGNVTRLASELVDDFRYLVSHVVILGSRCVVRIDTTKNPL